MTFFIIKGMYMIFLMFCRATHEASLLNLHSFYLPMQCIMFDCPGPEYLNKCIVAKIYLVCLVVILVDVNSKFRPNQ